MEENPDAAALKLRAPPVCCVVLGLASLYSLTCGLLSFHMSLAAYFLVFLATVLLATWFSGWSSHPSIQFLGLLGTLTLLLGTFVGTANYRTNYATVQAAGAGRSYTDLLPSAWASAHADAGAVNFSKATLDTMSGLGLQHGIYTYCVAPIMDESMSAAHGANAKAVQFWAVGVDCCRRRRDFQCGDAHLEGVTGGIVVPEDEVGPWGASPVVASFLAPRTAWGGYMAAVEAASAFYGLRTARPPIFVMWQKDSAKFLEETRVRTWVIWGASTALHLVVVFAAWVMIHWYYSAELRYALGVPDFSAHARGKRFNDPFLLSPGNPL